MTIWNGLFLRKHIIAVDFVDLIDMSSQDWQILDYPVLRPAARETLIRQMVSGGLTGFFRVNYDMHKATTHGGKPTYYYPASQADSERFRSGDFSEANFRNFKDYDRDVEPNFPDFDRREAMLSRTSSTAKYAVAAAIFYAVVADDDTEPVKPTEQEYEEWPEWARSLYVLSQFYSMELAELRQVASSLSVPAEKIRGMNKNELIDFLLEYALAEFNDTENQ